jgi:predicted lipid-binding transport protein (Tim44 family)
MEDLLFLILVMLCVVCLAKALAVVIWSPAPRVAAPKAQAPAPGVAEPLAGRRVMASPSPHRSPPAASSLRSRIQGRGRESGVRDSVASSPCQRPLGASPAGRGSGGVQQWHQGSKQP